MFRYYLEHYIVSFQIHNVQVKYITINNTFIHLNFALTIAIALGDMDVDRWVGV